MLAAVMIIITIRIHHDVTEDDAVLKRGIEKLWG